MAEDLKESKDKKNGGLIESDDSHEYDGIKELNNPAPYWIMAVFFVTIGFAMLYAIHNFGYPGNKQDQDSLYEKSVTKFEEKQALKKAMESGEPLQMSQEQIIEAGETLYADKGCMACHGKAGEGNAIGPNLTDNYWINGCSTEEIIEVIRNGRPAKGMTAYKNMMTEEQMAQLSSYIKLVLVGSEPANPRDPQGEECI
ncbi:MAG: cbb3-type cytochrome c oxidase N-terminal domain-containing protein [Marinilabiliaceae bacterium]|jgi:cytochrome c oxidase cbb3-type subunit 3|nr:cbb3-type cytochrome c oxidase N-terminal domain-containing protein [Marinilabiliaceae bacterium]